MDANEFRYKLLKSESTLNQGDKLVLIPPKEEISKHYLGDRVCEDFGFYPGMVMTVKSKMKDESGIVWVYFKEVTLEFKITSFIPLNAIKEEERVQIVKQFQEMWYMKRFLLFKYLKGQRVIFSPRNLTKSWFDQDYRRAGLIPDSTYKIKSIFDRKWLMLDEINFRVHWMDVKKFRP